MLCRPISCGTVRKCNGLKVLKVDKDFGLRRCWEETVKFVCVCGFQWHLFCGRRAFYNTASEVEIHCIANAFRNES